MLFYQLYTIHSLTSKGSHSLCLCSAIKMQQSKDLINYEQAARSAVKEVFQHNSQKRFLLLNTKHTARYNLKDCKENTKLMLTLLCKFIWYQLRHSFHQKKMIDVFETLQETMPPEADPIRLLQRCIY